MKNRYYKETFITMLLLLLAINGKGQMCAGTFNKVFQLDTASVTIVGGMQRVCVYQTGAVTTNTITVAEGNFNFDITIKNLNIVSHRVPIHIKTSIIAGSNGQRTTSILTITGKNKLVSIDNNNAAIQIEYGNNLAINASSVDSLYAFGGEYAAGIGAGNTNQGGSVNISGGFINAYGGKNAAGIGVSATMSCVSIEIADAVVNASYIGKAPNSWNSPSNGQLTIKKSSVYADSIFGTIIESPGLYNYILRLPNMSGIDSVIDVAHNGTKKSYKLGNNHPNTNDLNLFLPKHITGGNAVDTEKHIITTVMKNGTRKTYTARWNGGAAAGKWYLYSIQDYNISPIYHTYDGKAPSWNEIAQNLYPKTGTSAPLLPVSPTVASVNIVSSPTTPYNVHVNPYSFTLTGKNTWGLTTGSMVFYITTAPFSKEYIKWNFIQNAGIVDTTRGNLTARHDGQPKHIAIALKSPFTGISAFSPEYYRISSGIREPTPIDVDCYQVKTGVIQVSNQNFAGGSNYVIDTFCITPAWDTMTVNTTYRLSQATSMTDWTFVNMNTKILCTDVAYHRVKHTSGLYSSIAVRGVSFSGSEYDLSQCKSVNITTGGSYKIIQSDTAPVDKNIVIDCTDSVTITIENLNIRYTGTEPIINIKRSGSRVGVLFKGINRIERTSVNASSTIISPASGARVSLSGRFSRTDAKENDYLILTEKSEQSTGIYTANSGTIIVNDGNVQVESTRGNAVLGSAKGATSDGVTINGGYIRVNAKNGAAGIGSGTRMDAAHNSKCKKITINGGYIVVNTDNNGAAAVGAGNGAGSTCDSIVINGGFLRASAANSAANGIGAGNGSTCSAVFINGGSVEARSAGTINKISPAPKNNQDKGVFSALVNTTKPPKYENTLGVYFDGKPMNLWSNNIDNDSFYLYLQYHEPRDNNKFVDFATRQGRGVVRCTATWNATSSKYNMTCTERNASSRQNLRINAAASPGFRVATDVSSVTITAQVAAGTPLPSSNAPITAAFNEYLVKFKDVVVARGTVANDVIPTINPAVINNLPSYPMGMRHAVSVEYGGSFLNKACRFDSAIVRNYFYNYPMPPTLNAIYGDSLKTLTARLNQNNCGGSPHATTCYENWYWDDTTITVGNAGMNQMLAHFRYTISGMVTNYFGVDTLLTVIVAKRRPSFTLPAQLEAGYGSRLGNITALSPQWQWENPDSILNTPGIGYYNISYIPADPANYQQIDTALAVNVIQGIPPHESPAMFYANYGDTLKSLTFSDRFCDTCWRWAAPNTILSNVGQQRFRAFFVPLDAVNYQTLDVELYVMVEKATPPYSLPDNLSAYYGDTLKQMPMPQGWHWTRPDFITDTLHLQDANLDYYDSVIYIPNYTVGTAGLHTYPAVFYYYPPGAADFDTMRYKPVHTMLTLRVERSMPPLTMPQNVSAFYGEYLKDAHWGGYELWRQWTWRQDAYSTLVGAAGMQQHRAVFAYPSDTNYMLVDTIISILVKKAKIVVPETYCPRKCTISNTNDLCGSGTWSVPNYYVRPPVQIDATAGDVLSIVPLDAAGLWQWLQPDSVIHGAGSFCIDAVYTPADNTNYDTIVRSLPVYALSEYERIRTLVSVKYTLPSGEYDVGLNSTEPRRFEVDSCDVNSVDVRFYPYYNVKNFYSRNDTGYAVLPENNPTINLEIVRPDEYAVPFIVEFKNNARKQDTIYIVRRFSFNDIVVQKKGRILFVNNNDARNNKYDFVSYTWRKWDSDGSPIPIDNNTGQYYSEGQDELNANEYFSLELTTKDGKRLSTCKGSVSKARQGGDMTAYPIPAHGTITVENIHWEVDKIVKIYSRSGSLVQNYVAGSSTEVLDVSALQPDAYYLMNDNRSITIVIR